MITKTDLLLLLTEMQDKGLDTKEDVKYLMSSRSVPLDLLSKINKERQLDVARFYRKLRTSYNKKNSKLYINIMRSDENTITDPNTVLTTLSAMLNQILQFKANDKSMFLKHVRATEITQVLDIYFKTFNINPALKLLNLIKADIKVLESM